MMDLPTFLENFRRDADPERELRIWEGIAMVVAEVDAPLQLTFSERESLVIRLLQASTGVPARDLLVDAEDLRPEVAQAATRKAGELGWNAPA